MRYLKRGNVTSFETVFYIFLIFSGFSDDWAKKIFASTGEVVTAINGSNVELTCELNINLGASDLDNVTWIRSPRQILTRGIFRVTENDRITMAPQVLLRRQDFSLFIRPVLFEDLGEYRCAVVFQNAVHFRSVTLRILDRYEFRQFTACSNPDRENMLTVVVLVPPHQLVPPKITRSPVPFLKVDEGSSLQIDCAADGFPSPDIDWFVSRSNHTFDGGRFTMRTALEEFSSLDEKITGSKGTLKIDRLHRAMSGQLICVASNGVEPNDQTTVALSVRFPPDITMANRVIRQSLGMNTVLSCTVVANPPGIIQWYYNHHVKIIASSCEILSEEERKYCLRKYPETSPDRS
ncbi:hypothetical protein P879_02955 [Paragonimus westermani]|uniref:Ig-like domain-containing protein n=1 Tax=Paragonimus westermani TaxID=34504 RepID=A0A8T0DMQ1_9TREM|nr:hypothetical protein P879_02955 [Paragonimus westermani]